MSARCLSVCDTRQPVQMELKRSVFAVFMCLKCARLHIWHFIRAEPLTMNRLTSFDCMRNELMNNDYALRCFFTEYGESKQNVFYKANSATGYSRWAHRSNYLDFTIFFVYLIFIEANTLVPWMTCKCLPPVRNISYDYFRWTLVVRSAYARTILIPVIVPILIQPMRWKEIEWR